jgi:16S rRNA (cytidine1402-2'-O)-methyltransferase
VKSGGRERDLRAAAAREVTTVFFESPHRLLKTLDVCAQHFPERELCVARELTKQYEEFRIGTGPVLLAHYSAKPVKGEIVFLVKGAE